VRTGSTIAIVDVQGATTAVAIDPDARGLRVIGLEDARAAQVQAVALDARPSQLVAGRDGRIFVALRDTGVVVVFKWDETTLLLREAERFPIEYDVVAIALSADESKLATVSAAAEAFELVALEAHSRSGKIALDRSPRSIVTSGDRFVVSHAAGGRLTIVQAGEAKSQALALVRGDLPNMGPLPLLHQTGVVPLGDDLLVPGVTVATGETTVRTKDGYGHLASQRLGAHRFAIARIAQSTGLTSSLAAEALARVGMPAEGCLLPRAAIAHEGHLFVACAGPGRLFRIDLEPAASSWTAPVAIPDGTNGLAVDVEGKRIVAWSGEDASVAMVAIDSRASILDAKVLRGGPAVIVPSVYHMRSSTHLTNDFARGRAIFYGTNNPSVSRDGRACGSCHIDGTDDGLTWPTPEGPRQTPVLAGRVAQGAPYGWTGKRRALGVHIGETIHRLDGRGLAPADLDALIAFLKEMPQPGSPKLDDALIDQGRAIFESPKAECATCHNGPMLADGKLHGVKSQSKGDLQGTFDTPSLVGVGRSAPFFHDGRYRTLRELLTGVDAAMGKTKHLSPEELDALEAYVRSR
jgi:mono/diheme cytochrome c family protein